MYAAAQVFACLVNAAVDDEPDSYNWRISTGFAAVPAISMALGVGGLPESPRWLVSKGCAALLTFAIFYHPFRTAASRFTPSGREDEAMRALQMIRGPTFDATEELKVMFVDCKPELSEMVKW